MPECARSASPNRDDQKARRILNLLFVLNASRRPIPTSQIIGDEDLGYAGDNPESAMRKFRRDREELGRAGIHITEFKASGSSENEESSWIIDRERTHVGAGILTRDDAATIVAAIDELLHRENVPYRYALKRIRQKLDPRHTGPEGCGTDEDPLLGSLWDAYGTRRSIRFSYRGADGSETSRHAEIYGFFNRGGNAYIVARDVDKQAMRTFRVDRMDKLKKPRGAYSIPTDFNIGDYLFFAFDLGSEESFEAIFSIGDLPEPEARSLTQNRGTLTKTSFGWRWSIEVRSAEGAAAFALAHADAGVLPVRPEALTNAWSSLIERTVAAHG